MTEETKILDKIHSPMDLKRLSLKELQSLSEEIRKEILATISERGGHLASSLGVVELTIALHYVFDTPEDKIIWDVGHQCYPHKLLTGRREAFRTIRQYGGISGFPRRDESVYDAFGTGHASTSISAALGIAQAYKLQGKPNKVIAVIGDGGLSGGQALEALNQTPTSIDNTLDNLIVILNDNEMSIAPSVGSLSTYLTRMFTHQRLYKIVHFLRRLAKPLPKELQRKISDIGRNWRHSVLGFFTPGILFEAFGYHYIGPIDGHRLDLLISVLKQAKEFVDEPLFIHVLTKKGKGYEFAEKDPTTFHGIGPFDLETGSLNHSAKKAATYTEVFANTLIRLFEREPKLVAITAAMPQGTGLDIVQTKYPNRVFDQGITEPHCVTFAAGLTTEGFKTLVAIYSTFLQRAYDQILHDVCLQNLPVIFCLDRAGIVGEDGPTHNGLFDLSYLRNLPNMVIMAPKDENELQHMLYSAIGFSKPVAIRYPRGRGVGVVLDSEFKEIPLGKAELVEDGQKLAIIAIGNCVVPALKAAKRLKENGIDCACINARFAKPLDEDLIIDYAEKTGHLITVEENVLIGGFGSAVLELLEQRGLNWVKLKRIGIPDKFVEHGEPGLLRRLYNLDEEGIFNTVLEFLSKEETNFSNKTSSRIFKQ